RWAWSPPPPPASSSARASSACCAHSAPPRRSSRRCSSPSRWWWRSRAARSAGSSAPSRPSPSAAKRSRHPPPPSRCCCRWRCSWRSWSPSRARWDRCGWRFASTPSRRSVLDPRTRMEARLLWASLWRRRGTAGLAALAVAIGASVAAALLHVSGDVSVKLSRELRAFGPNLVLAPAAAGGERTLDEREARARCAAAGVSLVPDGYDSKPGYRGASAIGGPVLYASALVDHHAIPVAGADFDALGMLHPSWKWGETTRTVTTKAGAGEAHAGASLMRRMGWSVNDKLVLTSPDGARR